MTEETKKDQKFYQNILYGFQFGLGFFLANLFGFVILISLSSILLWVARSLGWLL